MNDAAAYVQGTDFKYYVNPVIYGDNWFVNFDTDNTLPEIVVRRNKKTSKTSAIKRMRKVLNSYGFKYKMNGYVINSERLFPPKFQGFDPAIAGLFELIGMIPVDGVEIHCQNILILKPEADGTYFTFYDPFEMSEVIKLVNNKKPSWKLVQWLTGLKKMSPSAITSANKELFKQYLDLDSSKGTLHLRKKIR